APEKVIVIDLFYLRGLDVDSVNIPYLLKIDDTWGWVAQGPKRQQVATAGALKVAEDVPVVDEGIRGIDILDMRDYNRLMLISWILRLCWEEIHWVQVFKFRGLPNLTTEGLTGRMLMEHRDAQGHIMFTSKDCRLIACSIAERSQAPEKVIVIDLFYLRGLDVDSVNIPYLLVATAGALEVAEDVPVVDEGA
nr:hypothetical protein [Tanacetum cinerariifolium]